MKTSTTTEKLSVKTSRVEEAVSDPIPNHISTSKRLEAHRSQPVPEAKYVGVEAEMLIKL